MKRSMDVNKEFLICRYSNGIKLLPEEQFKLNPSLKLIAKPIKYVADIMQMPFNVFFIEGETKIKSYNDSCCATLGVTSTTELIGHTIAKISNNSRDADKIHRNNKRVIENKQFSVIKEKNDLLDDTTVHAISFKMPWFGENDEIVGVFGCAVVVHLDTLDSIGNHLEVISNMFLPPQTESKDLLAVRNERFTPREVDVIQWVVRGKTMREIGLILGLKTRTIEGYFAEIKMKMGVNKKSELIESVMLKTALS